MSMRPSLRALDALLAEHRPPPAPQGLAARVAEQATALAQEAALPGGARARRDRRLRRPLITAAAVLGLSFSSAVAARLAGITLPPPVESVIERIPFMPAAAPQPLPAPRARASQIAASPSRQGGETEPTPPAGPTAAAPPPPGSFDERMQRAREIVAARRADGLPTPYADRIEQAIKRRRELERQGGDLAEFDRLQRQAHDAAILRQRLIRAEVIRRARAGDPQAIALIEEHRRRQQERSERWLAEQEQMQMPPANPQPAGEGFPPDAR